ncbi:MAG: hypothetical protein ACJAXQ_000323 [Parvibaculaceae bacterium]|jgi:hypothetical protein
MHGSHNIGDVVSITTGKTGLEDSLPLALAPVHSLAQKHVPFHAVQFCEAAIISEVRPKFSYPSKAERKSGAQQIVQAPDK